MNLLSTFLFLFSGGIFAQSQTLTVQNSYATSFPNMSYSPVSSLVTALLPPRSAIGECIAAGIGITQHGSSRTLLLKEPTLSSATYSSLPASPSHITPSQTRSMVVPFSHKTSVPILNITQESIASMLSEVSRYSESFCRPPRLITSNGTTYCNPTVLVPVYALSEESFAAGPVSIPNRVSAAVSGSTSHPLPSPKLTNPDLNSPTKTSDSVSAPQTDASPPPHSKKPNLAFPPNSPQSSRHALSSNIPMPDKSRVLPAGGHSPLQSLDVSVESIVMSVFEGSRHAAGATDLASILPATVSSTGQDGRLSDDGSGKIVSILNNVPSSGNKIADNRVPDSASLSDEMLRNGGVGSSDAIRGSHDSGSHAGVAAEHSIPVTGVSTGSVGGMETRASQASRPPTTTTGQGGHYGSDGIYAWSEEDSYSSNTPTFIDPLGSIFTVGHQISTGQAGEPIVVESRTLLSAGSETAIDGQVISVGTGSVIVLGSKTIAYSAPSNAPASLKEVFAIGRQTYTAVENAAGMVATDGTTLSLGGSPVAVNGQAMSLGSLGIAASGKTYGLPTASPKSTQAQKTDARFAIGGKLYTAHEGTGLDGGLVAMVGSKSLEVGRSAATIDGQVISMGTDGLVVGPSNVAWKTISALDNQETTAVFTMSNGHVLTALETTGAGGMPEALIGSTTLVLDGAAASLHGETLSLGSHGLILDGSNAISWQTTTAAHIAAETVITAHGDALTATETTGPSGVFEAIVSGATLSFGGSATTIIGEILSMGSTGIVFSGTSTGSWETIAGAGSSTSSSPSSSTQRPNPNVGSSLGSVWTDLMMLITFLIATYML